MSLDRAPEPAKKKRKTSFLLKRDTLSSGEYEKNTHELQLFSQAELAGFDLIVVGFPSKPCCDVLSALGGCCRRTLFADNLGDADLLMRQALEQLNALLIVHTHQSGLLLDELLFFRREWLASVIVMAAADLSNNDFSVERGMICDSSIKVPYSAIALALGVESAIKNNEIMRLRSMHHWAAF